MADFFGTLFGGESEKEAAAKNKGELQQYKFDSLGALDRGLFRSEDALREGRNTANWYQGRNYGLYGDMRGAGTDILNRGLSGGLAALGAAGAAYDPLAGLGAKYGQGTDLYLDSLGVRGAEGNRRAVDSFQAGPGYEFTRDQGLEALNRRRAAAGMLNSGNADIDALKFGTGLANQTYGGWQDRLAGLINPELSATSGAATGRAGVGTNMANMIGADTAARLGLEGAVTGGQAGANTSRGVNDVALGNTLAGLYTGNAGNQVGVFGNVASGNMGANNLQAQGEISGAKNVLNAGMGLANLAANAYTGGMGGSFGNMFSQTFGNGTGYQTNPWSKGGMFG